MKKVLPVALTLVLAIMPAAMAEEAAFGAEAGDAQAQYELAEQYYTQERDFVKAAEAMTKAAEAGAAQAQLELGLYYYTGQGVDADLGEAIRWWESAADQGNTEAMRYLGYLYENGEGVAVDTGKAVKYYMEAAELGDAEAQYTLGDCYAKGVGVAIDEELAAEYYSQAASNGDPEAQMAMGIRYYEQGNYDRALIYLQAAATQGDSTAQYTLGYMYANGQGVEKDKNQAMSWWKMAGKNGNGEAIEAYFYMRDQGEEIDVLKKGTSSADVENIQEALSAMGYLAGDVTGKFDGATEAAVKNFQKAHELEQTGVVDPTTRAYIEFQDLDLYVAKVDFISLQNPDVTPRLFVSFKNTGDRNISQIVFQVKPLDENDKEMLAYHSYETITCTSDRPLKSGETEAKGYYWTLNGCQGVRGVELAISSVTFEDGTEITLNENALNWITYSNNNR